jgi:hypothetical protein
VGRRLIVADSDKSDFYVGASESPANVPRERKHALLGERGIVSQRSGRSTMGKFFPNRRSRIADLIDDLL